jgi:aspartate kinase/aspartokinase/homoserine dehydrogenase 1
VVILIDNDMITVHKFGGSCLRDSSDLERISQVIKQTNGQSIIVVSALWGTTDRLLRASHEPRYAGRLVHDLEEQHLRFSPGLAESNIGYLFSNVLRGIETSLVELAMKPENNVAKNRLLAAGERLSALVVSHFLNTKGINSHPVGAEDIGLRLNGKGKAPTVDLESSRNNLDLSSLQGTPVLTGWFGQGTDGELALLGRGGSDHTATAMELSRLDTPVLHPATVEPLAAVGIPLEIMHLYQERDFSQTIIGPDIHDEYNIKGIGCLASVAYLSIETLSLEEQSKNLGQLLVDLATEGITCWHIHSQPGELKIIISQHDIIKSKKIITTHFQTPTVEVYSAMISLIGNGNESEQLKLFDEIGNLFGLELLSQSPHSLRLLAKEINVNSLLVEMSERFHLCNTLHQ